jgi:hypothetical protein
MPLCNRLPLTRATVRCRTRPHADFPVEVAVQGDALAVRGDDWGNITAYEDGRESCSALGMNRLNHCPPIFQEGYRSGDRQLLEEAVLRVRSGRAAGAGSPGAGRSQAPRRGKGGGRLPGRVTGSPWRLARVRRRGPECIGV